MSNYKKDTPVETLIPYARNARTHSEAQVAQIAASIREFGFCNPVLIDKDGGIIAGHGRVLAAQRLGLKVVPTITLGHLSETQKRAYILADNKLALNAGWDDEMLKVELESLHEADFNMDLLGFDAADLSIAMGFENELATTESSAQEINVDDYKMSHTCPKCGFEFNDKA
jgi:ParB family transcriptional regulator, chromosome partitioning protein